MYQKAKQYGNIMGESSPQATNCCYAKVFDDNTRSRKGLEKLGFRQLPFVVAPPNESEVIYYLGADKSESVLFGGLEQLFAAQQADIRLTGIIDWQLGLI